MNLFTRVVGYAATTMVLCAVLFSFAGMWFGEDGSGQRLARRLVLEKRRSEALRYQREALSHSWEAKARIIRALIDGRLRLREAIDQFQRLNKELNEALASEDVDQGMVAARVPFLTDSDSIGQTILMWVRVEVAAWPPDKAKRLLADLESAFQELLRSNVKWNETEEIGWRCRSMRRTGCPSRKPLPSCEAPDPPFRTCCVNGRSIVCWSARSSFSETPNCWFASAPLCWPAETAPSGNEAGRSWNQLCSELTELGYKKGI